MGLVVVVTRLLRCDAQVCKKLRVMNAVRRFDVGIPITFMQYEVLTAEVLLEHLQQRCVVWECAVCGVCAPSSSVCRGVTCCTILLTDPVCLLVAVVIRAS